MHFFTPEFHVLASQLLASFLGISPIINHGYLSKMRLNQRHKFLVGWMGQVCVPVGFAEKGNKKAVSVTLAKALGAIIGTPLKIVDYLNLVGQVTERLFNLLDLLRCGRVFERKQHHVTQDSGGVIKLMFTHVRQVSLLFQTDLIPVLVAGFIHHRP